jgi:hypothetical protein
MNKLSVKQTKVKKLIQIAKSNNNKAKEEIRKYTLNLLQDHWYDNLSNMIDSAVNRGFFAVDWINFWGLGIIDTDLTIRWAYDCIKHQGMEDILEPFYNNSNHRLGIMLNRKILENEKIKNENFLVLSFELQ